VGSHAAVAAEFLGDQKLVAAIVKDHRSAPISEKEKAFFDYVVAANAARGVIDKKWVEKARAAGWSDAALYDAATVVALFNFYNRWIDATGVHDMPAAAYKMSGERLKANGYIHD
jgi:alkylhydroperoxidase family enzyme